jgi:hypothetical protein
MMTGLGDSDERMTTVDACILGLSSDRVRLPARDGRPKAAVRPSAESVSSGEPTPPNEASTRSNAMAGVPSQERRD